MKTVSSEDLTKILKDSKIGIRANLQDANLIYANLIDANLIGANLRGANLSDANLRGANLSYDFKVSDFCIIAGGYPYISMAIVSDAGVPWVRMGCLWKTVAEWDSVGIKQSNVSEFPDDESEKSVERALLFEFARAMALRMAAKFAKENQS